MENYKRTYWNWKKANSEENFFNMNYVEKWCGKNQSSYMGKNNVNL